MSFSDTDEENLINLVKPCPVIYDVNHEDYRNNVKKENTWKKIGEELGKSSEDCKRKWKFIRDGYKRFTKKNRLTATTAKSAKGKRHQQLAFLEKFPERKSRTLNPTENEEHSDLDDVSLDQQQKESVDKPHDDDEEQHEDPETEDEKPIVQLEVKPTSLKRLKQKPDDNKLSPVKRQKKRDALRQTLLKSIARRENDDIEHFTRHMAQVLRKLPPVQKAEAKHSLNSVLSQYEIMAAKLKAGEDSSASFEMPESSFGY